LGTIDGIFHLAVSLNDALYENHAIKTFRETCESKINTFVNLDKLTRALNLNLDYFVCFSSVSCGSGNAGQTNYGYAYKVQIFKGKDRYSHVSNNTFANNFVYPYYSNN
jgi:fatty acid synthase